jgi:sirohydrochlorin cobaltochelatase
MTTALILAGHGSHISPQTAGLVWRHVDRLRALGVADEVTAAFWKEQPSFANVLYSIYADDITVIPVFTAKGFFAQSVIPAEMGLTGAITERDGRRVRYTPSLHEHPYLAQVVRARVDAALRDYDLPPEQTALAIIGHSTRRNPDSRKATEAHAERLRAARVAAEVHAVYLDDEPEIAEIYTLSRAPNLIAVPYFLAAGSHTTIDVPRELGLEPGANQGTVNRRQVIYTAPVGVDDDLLNVILALAREAGAPLYEPKPTLDAWQGFPAVAQHIPASFLRHNRDQVSRFGGLRLSLDDVRAWGDDEAHEIIETPAALRQRVRENPFRSLATSDDLPRGWRVPITDPAQIHAVVETVYPGVIGLFASEPAGQFRAHPLAETARRQLGMYRSLETLPRAAQSKLVARVCGRCILEPLWFEQPEIYELPCPEPCNHWLSAASEETS